MVGIGNVARDGDDVCELGEVGTGSFEIVDPAGVDNQPVTVAGELVRKCKPEATGGAGDDRYADLAGGHQSNLQPQVNLKSSPRIRP
jgi:hypothetical protein